MVLAGLILPFLPLLPIQVLLTNLIYNSAQIGLPLDNVDVEVIERPIHWDIRLIERFMIRIGPISTVFDVTIFAVLLLVFQPNEAIFRIGWFVESLVTQILMIFAVRTSLPRSRLRSWHVHRFEQHMRSCQHHGEHAIPYPSQCCPLVAGYDEVDEIMLGRRLIEHAGYADLGGARNNCWRGKRGDEQDGNLVAVRPQPRRQLQPRHLRHMVIEDDTARGDIAPLEIVDGR